MPKPAEKINETVFGLKTDIYQIMILIINLMCIFIMNELHIYN